MEQANLTDQYRTTKRIMAGMGVRYDRNLFVAYEECQKDSLADDDYILQFLRDSGEAYSFLKYIFIQRLKGDELVDLITAFPKSAAFSCFRQLQRHYGARQICLVFPVKRYKNWVLHNFEVRNAAAPSIELPSPWDGEMFSLCRLDDFIPLIGTLPYMLDPDFDNTIRPPYPDFGKINLEVCKINLD